METLSLDLSSHGDSKSRVWQSWADVKHHSAVYYITIKLLLLNLHYGQDSCICVYVYVNMSLLEVQ